MDILILFYGWATKNERTTMGLASVGRDDQTISFYNKSTFDLAIESNSN